MPTGIYIRTEEHRGENHHSWGKHLSEETKRKIGLSNSISHKGKKLSEEHKQKLSEAGRGKKLSEKTKRRMSEAKKGKLKSEKTKRRMSEAKKGKPKSEKTKQRMSEAKKGKKHTEETKRRISEAKKGKKYKPMSREGKKNMSEAHKGKCTREKNNNWQGGISFEPYSVDWTETLRRAIRERDHYLCSICKQYGNRVHHIDYNKKNCCPENLITLCNSCHMKTNFNREKWIKFFKEKIKVEIKTKNAR